VPRRMDEEIVEVVDRTVGDIIDELIERYYGDKVDQYIEYEELLAKIADEIMSLVFKGRASPVELEAYLRKLREKKGYARLVLSYLIGKTLELREEVEGYAPLPDNARG